MLLCLLHISKCHAKDIAVSCIKNKKTNTKKQQKTKMAITMLMTRTITSHHHCHNLLFLIQTVHSLSALQFLAAPYKFSHLSNTIILP